MRSPIQGVVTSLVTPFECPAGTTDGTRLAIDEDCFHSLVKTQARAGVEAIAVAGWIGEGPTLSREERRRLLAIARKASLGRIKVLAHAGSCDTARSIAYTIDAASEGADGLIVVTPPYSRPNLAGFRRHVLGVADNTDLPIYLEFDPDRTRSPVTIRDMVQLMEIAGVAGVIDHSANILHVEALSAVRRREVFLTACERNCVASLGLGGDGVFSAIANIVPLCVVELELAWRMGRFETARDIQASLLPLMQVVEDEGPAAVKRAVAGHLAMVPHVRLPLLPLSDDACERLDDALRIAAPMRAAIEEPRLLRFAQ